MIKNLQELAAMIARRDNITLTEATEIVNAAKEDMEHAFYNGSLNEAEDILRESLSIEPDYLDLFIF